MPSPKALLNNFRGDPSAEKCEILQALEAHIEDREVKELLLEIVTREADEDVRIEAFKLLTLLRAGEPLVDKIASAALITLLDQSQEDHIRGYAAMGLQGFCGRTDVVKALSEVVLNESEDISLRYNVFDTLQVNRGLTSCRNLLTQLLDDPELGGDAKTAIEFKPPKKGKNT